MPLFSWRKIGLGIAEWNYKFVGLGLLQKVFAVDFYEHTKQSLTNHKDQKTKTLLIDGNHGGYTVIGYKAIDEPLWEKQSWRNVRLQQRNIYRRRNPHKVQLVFTPQSACQWVEEINWMTTREWNRSVERKSVFVSECMHQKPVVKYKLWTSGLPCSHPKSDIVYYAWHDSCYFSSPSNCLQKRLCYFHQRCDISGVSPVCCTQFLPHKKKSLFLSG